MQTHQLIGRAVRGAVLKKQGELHTGTLDSPPHLVARRRAVGTDPAQLERYERVCELEPRADRMPPCWPEVLFISPMAELAVDPAFPLSPLGLIHTEQVVEQLTPIPRDARLDLEARLSSLREGPKGIEAVIETDAFHGAERVWKGQTVLLSRSARARSGGSKGAGSKGRRAEPLAGEPRIFDVNGDTGVRYARASGDYNPHHLFPWTAKPLGYRRPIAHGMWTLARALGLVEREVDLPDALRIDCAFKRPLFLPGRFAFRSAEDGDRVRFEVREPDTGAPHVLATLERDG